MAELYLEVDAPITPDRRTTCRGGKGTLLRAPGHQGRPGKRRDFAQLGAPFRCLTDDGCPWKNVPIRPTGMGSGFPAGRRRAPLETDIMRLRAVEITGAGESIRVEHLLEVSQEFPFVEWGILLCMCYQPDKLKLQYPSLGWLNKAADAGLTMSGHVCGGAWLGDICAGRLPPDLDFRPYKRVQLNSGGNAGRTFVPRPWRKQGRLQRCRKYADLIRDTGPSQVAQCLQSLPDSVKEVILQVKTEEDEDLAVTVAEILMASGRPVSLLYDPSKGRGVYDPSSWRKPAHRFPCGFTGGLNTQYIDDALERLSSLLSFDERIWVGMQTGAKTDGQLDLGKVRTFLKRCEPYTE